MRFEEFKEIYPEPGIASFLVNERIDRDKIVLKKIYIDMAEDLIAGIVLNQIIFWHCPNDSGEVKLTVLRDGHLWLRKKREDWWKECRITASQFDKACRKLNELDLIQVASFKWNGAPTKHIRVDWDVFLAVFERAKASYGEREGYRRRQPTKTSGANRSKHLNAAISTNSENQPNSAISENPTSLLAKIPEVHYQRKSNFANSENDLYTMRHFNETTNETIKSPPKNETENLELKNKVNQVSSLQNPQDLPQADKSTPEIKSSAPACDNTGDIDIETKKLMEKMAWNWRSRPWRLSATEFKPGMVNAVFQSNPKPLEEKGFGLKAQAGQVIPNEPFIMKYLEKLEGGLLKFDAKSLSQLQAYWRTAEAIASTPQKAEAPLSELAMENLRQKAALEEARRQEVATKRNLTREDVLAELDKARQNAAARRNRNASTR